MSSRSASTGVFTRSTRSARCSASRAALTRRPMPTFIPARGRTLHLAGVCVNRIGRLHSLSQSGRQSDETGATGVHVGYLKARLFPAERVPISTFKLEHLQSFS